MKRTMVMSLFFLALNGCIIAPIIHGVSDLGVTQRDRERLLNQDVKRFNDALYWGQSNEALAYVPEDNRPSVAASLMSHGRDERIVESKIDSMMFSNGSFDASVSVIVRYYKVPVYMVQERRDDQKWKFSVTNGWRLISHQSSKPG